MVDLLVMDENARQRVKQLDAFLGLSVFHHLEIDTGEIISLVELKAATGGRNTEIREKISSRNGGGKERNQTL